MKDLMSRTLTIAEADLGKIKYCFALLWTVQPCSTVYNLLKKINFKNSAGRYFTLEEVKQCVEALAKQGLILQAHQRSGYYGLTKSQRDALYLQLLETSDSQLLKKYLYETFGYSLSASRMLWSYYERDQTVALVRVTLLTQCTLKDVEHMISMIDQQQKWSEVFQQAFLHDFEEAIFLRIAPEVRWALIYSVMQSFRMNWEAELATFANWALAQASSKAPPLYTRVLFAELMLHRGEREAALKLLQGIDDPVAEELRAYALVQQAKWAEAQALFESVLKIYKSKTGMKVNLLLPSISWLYPLTLLAQQTPKHLELARKYCLGESCKRLPDLHYGWGLWVRSIDIKSGEAEPEPNRLITANYYAEQISLDQLWRVLLAAWLGQDALLHAEPGYQNMLSKVAQLQADRFKQCGFKWLETLASGAKSLINGGNPPPDFFVKGNAEHWREVLSALQTLGGEAAITPGSSDASRLIWIIDADSQGALKSLQPMEQKHGARGWSKPKAVALSKIAGNSRLSPWDAKVANCISKYGVREVQLDLPNALQALIGHPLVAFRSKPEQFIELCEGAPEIEVIHSDGHVSLKVTPPLRAAVTISDHPYYDKMRLEAEALRLITLVQDSAQRVRLIRFSPSQRRAAQLLAENLHIPESAQQELQGAMQALTRHFQLQADHLQASREVPAEARLRAELSPLNDGLLLRLVVAPFGIEGPRLPPGSGRTRLMSLIGSESLGVSRELKIERMHLESVLDALPFLEHCAGDREQCEWEVAEPEDALALVELLPTLPAIVALDWPKGKAVKVVSVDLSQLSVQVKSQRDWFKLQGEAKIDEGMVFTFEALLAAAQSSSRFIAMGNGVYAALTRRLKERLRDLASVIETDKQGARIPMLAAAWMDDALEGIDTKADREFHSALKKLRATQQNNIPLPGTLQAVLRPYQEDGYVWAARLAEAGFGGCLADDMGLGKTLQALAVLLKRAEFGPALIIAPTSVCGNWITETTRFAPSLNLHLYSEADREAVIKDAAAFDVVVVSYTLLQQAIAQFSEKQWHSLIVDEAQAIKNATTKRTQAIFELNADFRLALSGTPVENRLSELWSIMRFSNPGLLGSLTRFNERFVIPIERDKDRDALHILRRLISPFLLRRTKSQVLQELPPRTELTIKIVPGKEEAAHYEAMRRQALMEADEAVASNKAGQARMNILAQLTRLRRAACDPRIVTPVFPASGSKVQTFTNLALELVANGHKALVFSQFVDFLTLLRESLDAAQITYQYLDGATPATERTKRVAAFQAGKSDLFLISLKAGGFGLNLTAADYVVITDPWWNPAAEDQAMGRAHRMGQLRPVTVYRLVTQGTVEEHIVGMHNDKRALAESILGEGDAVSLPSTEELISLIRGD